MKRTIVWLAFMLTGCVVDVDPETVQTEQHESSSPDQTPWSTDTWHANGCGAEWKLFEFPDGEQHMMPIPVFCNPYYMYMGYPLPEEHSKSNPSDEYQEHKNTTLTQQTQQVNQ